MRRAHHRRRPVLARAAGHRGGHLQRAQPVCGLQPVLAARHPHRQLPAEPDRRRGADADRVAHRVVAAQPREPRAEGEQDRRQIVRRRRLAADERLSRRRAVLARDPDVPAGDPRVVRAVGAADARAGDGRQAARDRAEPVRGRGDRHRRLDRRARAARPRDEPARRRRCRPPHAASRQSDARARVEPDRHGRLRVRVRADADLRARRAEDRRDLGAGHQHAEPVPRRGAGHRRGDRDRAGDVLLRALRRVARTSCWKPRAPTGSRPCSASSACSRGCCSRRCWWRG